MKTFGSQTYAPLALKDMHIWLSKICTSGIQKILHLWLSKIFAPLTFKDFAPLALKGMHVWLSKICTYGFQRYAPMTFIDMHLWLSKICTSGSQRYAPLALKDMHLWFLKINLITYSIAISRLWILLLNLSLALKCSFCCLNFCLRVKKFHHQFIGCCVWLFISSVISLRQEVTLLLKAIFAC